MALKKKELNRLKLKVGDKIWVRIGTECDDDRCKVAKKVKVKVKVTVVGLYPRWFRVRVDGKSGSYYTGINYISCYSRSKKLIYKRVV